MLTIRLTKVSPTHHRFEYKREDGTGENKELESKSFLTHDFLHFCVEMEGGTQNGFYGYLASGKTLDDLTRIDLNDDAEMRMVEQIVGALTGITRGEDVSQALKYLENIWNLEGIHAPKYLTGDFIERVASLYKRVIGEWKSIPFGESMVIKFVL